jgi:hypothetical protein
VKESSEDVRKEAGDEVVVKLEHEEVGELVESSCRDRFEHNDKSSILNTLIVADQGRYEHFVAKNPESVLPVNLDVDLEIESDPLNCQVVSSHVSPSDSIKETDTSVLWTEVVRKGKNRSKCRSRKEKIGEHDRHILEY